MKSLNVSTKYVAAVLVMVLAILLQLSPIQSYANEDLEEPVAPSEVSAGRLYLPLINRAKAQPVATPTPIPTPPPGSRAPLSQKDCDSLTSGVGVLRFVISEKKWTQGTLFSEIIAYYNMFAGDFEVNAQFFPARKINVYDVGFGQVSGVCLLEKKKYTGKDGGNITFEWYEGEPEWHNQLEGMVVSANPNITVTYTLLGNQYSLTEQSWLGAGVIGLVRLGGREGLAIGHILKVPAGSLATKVLVGAPGALLTLVPFIAQITNATTQALNMPASLLGPKGQSVIWLHQNIAAGYLVCSADAALLSDQIGSPNRTDSRRVYFNGNGNAGCVISAKAWGNAKLYKWQVLELSAIRATVMEKTNDQEVADLIAEIEKMLANTNENTGDDITIIPSPSQDDECPPIPTAANSDLRWEAIFLTVQNHDYNLSHTEINPITIPELTKLRNFTQGVIGFLPATTMDDRYITFRPRTFGTHGGHLTTALTSYPPADMHHYTLETVCVWNAWSSILFGYSWYLDIKEGRLRSAVTSTYPDGEDYIEPFEIVYNQYAP